MMARWPEDEKQIGFDDMPKELKFVGLDDPDELKQARRAWLESHGLSFVDFLAWKRASDPAAKLRPPARRKLMTAEQLAEFDRQREEEGDPRW